MLSLLELEMQGGSTVVSPILATTYLPTLFYFLKVVFLSGQQIGVYVVPRS